MSEITSQVDATMSSIAEPGGDMTSDMHAHHFQRVCKIIHLRKTLLDPTPVWHLKKRKKKGNNKNALQIKARAVDD